MTVEAVVHGLAEQLEQIAQLLLDLTEKVEQDIRTLEVQVADLQTELRRDIRGLEEQNQLDQQAMRQMREQHDTALRSLRRGRQDDGF